MKMIEKLKRLWAMFLGDEPYDIWGDGKLVHTEYSFGAAVDWMLEHGGDYQDIQVRKGTYLVAYRTTTAWGSVGGHNE